MLFGNLEDVVGLFSVLCVGIIVDERIVFVHNIPVTLFPALVYALARFLEFGFQYKPGGKRLSWQAAAYGRKRRIFFACRKGFGTGRTGMPDI